MSRLLSKLKKTGLSLGMSGGTLIQGVDTKHKQKLYRLEEETKRVWFLKKTQEKENTKRPQEEENAKIVHELALVHEKTLQEQAAIELAKHKLDVEGAQHRAI